MSDQELRRLERFLRDSPDDVRAWVRYVTLLDQMGTAPPADLDRRARRIRASLAEAPAHATIDVGDEVWVDEHDTPWIVGRWRALVVHVYLERDERKKRDYIRFRVWPVMDDSPDADPIPWRVRPNAEQRVRGIELSRDDRVELLARGKGPPPDQVDAWPPGH